MAAEVIERTATQVMAERIVDRLLAFAAAEAGCPCQASRFGGDRRRHDRVGGTVMALPLARAGRARMDSRAARFAFALAYVFVKLIVCGWLGR